MRNVCQRSSLVAVLVGVLGTLPSFPLQAGAESSDSQSGTVATVISITGEGYAEGPDGRRNLECNTPIRRGEHVVTPAGARVGLVSSDVYVQLDSGTDVTVDRGESGVPSFSFAMGHARVVDTRESGDALSISGAGSVASGLGTDTEVVVTGDRAEYCEKGADLGVEGAKTRVTAKAGECLEVPAGKSPAASSKTAGEVPMASPSDCFDVGLVGHFTPDVAAPPTRISLAPIDLDRRVFGPCDDPGSGCGLGDDFPAMVIREQPPVPIPGPGR
jgi:hypothetical protein